MEKEVSYNTKNSYSTLNTFSNKTKNVWFVCHGISFLSRYFLKYFNDLNPKENYIIAPQAQSKYYLGYKYKHVGASWLTRENTQKEIDNLMKYLDAVFDKEKLPDNVNLIALGFSQGVSVIMRYMAKKKLICSQLVLLSGMIPKELTREDFEFLNGKTKVSLIYGTNDEFLSEEKLIYEKKRFNELFGNEAIIIPFDGKHEVNKQVIKDLISPN